MQITRNIDLHLLACLDALLTERQVTRAAERMSMTQPGMSNALARLRRMLNDPLLVRTGHGMVLTDRAKDLMTSVKAALAHIDTALACPEGFEPSRSDATFKISISDYVLLALMPALMDLILKNGPGMKINATLSDAKRLREWLEEGQCHLAIGYFTELADGLYKSDLWSDEICCVARADHNVIRRRISLEQYLAAQHIYMMGAFQPATFEMMTDGALAALGMSRRIAIHVPSMVVAPAIVAQTDLVATLPRELARIYAAQLSLQVLKVPFRVPRYRLAMIWHERTKHDGAHKWLREQVRSLAQHLLPGRPPRHEDLSRSKRLRRPS